MAWHGRLKLARILQVIRLERYTNCERLSAPGSHDATLTLFASGGRARTYNLLAPSEAEAGEWVKAISDFLSKYANGRAPFFSKPMPDRTAPARTAQTIGHCPGPNRQRAGLQDRGAGCSSTEAVT